MNLLFTPLAWQEYCLWQAEDAAVLARLNLLITDVRRDLFAALANPRCYARIFQDGGRVVSPRSIGWSIAASAQAISSGWRSRSVAVITARKRSPFQAPDIVLYGKFNDIPARPLATVRRLPRPRVTVRLAHGCVENRGRRQVPTRLAVRFLIRNTHFLAFGPRP